MKQVSPSAVAGWEPSTSTTPGGVSWSSFGTVAGSEGSEPAGFPGHDFAFATAARISSASFSAWKRWVSNCPQELWRFRKNYCNVFSTLWHLGFAPEYLAKMVSHFLWITAASSIEHDQTSINRNMMCKFFIRTYISLYLLIYKFVL